MGNAIDNAKADLVALTFPGRKTLYVHEVAQLLQIDDQQVRDLIEEGALHAINVGGGTRKHWRIPVTALERFMQTRSSLA
jgi:excisionase family DNA binding protein